MTKKLRDLLVWVEAEQAEAEKLDSGYKAPYTNDFYWQYRASTLESVADKIRELLKEDPDVAKPTDA